MKKQILSLFMAVLMVVSLLPTTAFAAVEDNLCDHHTEHTADCGYAPAVEGSPCTHVHDDTCGYIEAVEGVPCACVAAEDDTLTHAEGCGYVEAVAGSDCTHVHDDACGYVEAAAEVPCGYVCEESHGGATRVIYVDESTFLASGYSRFYDANVNLLTTTREEQEDGWVKYTMPADAKYYLTFDGHLGGGGGDNYPVLPTNADTYDPYWDTWSCSHPGYAEGNCRLCGAPCPGHTGGTATCTTLAVCKNCGASYGELNANNHNWENGVCTYECGTTHDPHTFENGTCTLCGAPCPGHTYDNACDAECNVCSETREVGDHVYDGAQDAECNECGYVRDITPVQITGISITVDGDTYTSGNVTITPDSTVILTVTGTNLHNGSDDHRVDYASGVYQPVTPDYFEISEDGTVATYEPSTGDFAKSSSFEITYCNNDTDTANRTVVSTGIYLTYDDGIAEENRARITGMSITIDGVVYDSSNTSAEDPAVITPNTEFIIITVHGTALQNCTTDHVVSYYSGSSQPILANNLWHFEADGTGAYHYYSSASALSDFARNTTPYELQYSNNGSFNAANPAIGSGVYIVYDDSTGGGEDTTSAEITGVSITIDGVVYDSSNTSAENPAVINPSSTITLTVTGTNLQNGTGDNRVNYADGFGQPVSRDYFEINEDGTTATCELSTGGFANSSNFEITYYNNYTDTDNRTAISTGIFLTYDDSTGGEEDTTPDSTGKILVDMQDSYGDGWNGAAIDIYKNGSLEQTVTVDKTSNTVFLDYDSTATYEFKWIKGDYDSECSFTIYEDGEEKLSVTDASVYENGETIWPQGDTGGEEGGDDTIGGEEDTTPAEITGVSITVDGETYTSGNVTITPTSTITFTVTGTNLQNGTDDNYVEYAFETARPVTPLFFTISEDGTSATFVPSFEAFADCRNYEIVYYNNYTDTDNRVKINTGIYLTYDDGTGEEGGDDPIEPDTTPAEITGVSITVDGVTYTEGDVTITPTSTIIVTVTGTNFANLSGDHELDLGSGLTIFMNTWRWKIDSAANTATADFSDLNSEFGDHKDYEIMYSNGGGQGLTGTGIYLTYDDGTGGEEDTTPAEITGVSITVDGVTYTEGDVTITPTSTIIVTVTGTNVANLSAANILDLGPGLTVFMGTWRWETDSAANTATADFSDLNPEFGDHNGTEIMYSNDSNQNWTGTGIYLTYDDGSGGEEDTTPAEITGISITIDGEEYVGSDTSAENPAVITSEAASVILTVHGTNLQYATDEQWVSYMSTGNCVTLDNSDWTKSEDGSLASLDLTFLTESFIQSISVWEIKYSSNGGGLEDAVTGLYVKYEHIPEEALWGTDADNLTNGGTFTEAIAAAGADSDITYIRLGTDVTDDWGYEIESGVFTLDLNGHTLKADQSYALTLKNAGTVVTLTDTAGGGAAIGGSTFAAVLASNGAKVLINGGSYSGLDAVSANSGGFVEINGGSFTGKGGFAVAVGAFSDVKIAGGSFSGLYSSVVNSGTATITGGSFGVGEYGHFAYSEGKLDLSGYDQEKLNGLKLCQRTGNDLTVSDENIKLPEGYAFKDSEDNTVTTLSSYVIYTIGAAGTGGEEEPIVITQQPTNSEAKLGERYCVEVIAQGDGLKYQWYFRKVGVESWSKSSVTDNTYDDVMTAARHNREVKCVITDVWGNSVETDIATITGTAAVKLAITKQPESQTVKLGDMFNVTFEAQGDGLKYQWYFRQAGTEVWYTSGQRDNSYDDVMTVARHDREVYCVVTDAWGNTVSTDTATLKAIKGPKLEITKQPNDASAKLNEEFCVTVEAQGDGLKYQWYFRKVGAESWIGSGVKDNTYDDVMTAARHNREVYCVITDAWGNSVTSEIATIKGIATVELGITRMPADQTVTLGDMFNVTFDAVGDGLTYQWYFRKAGTEVWYTSGQRDNSYDDVMTAARHNRELYCVVTDAWGNSVTTDPVVVIMATQKHELQILQQPNDASAKLGERFNVEVIAQGDGLTYQWYFRQAGTDRWNVSGVRDNTYDDVMTKARHNREVKCVITDMWGNSVETDIALIAGTPTETLAIVTQPTDAVAAIGENYCVTVEAQGDGLSYQWYFRNAGASHWSKSGVTDNTYDDVMTKTRAGRQVYCVITDAWGHSVTTDTVTLVCN